MKKFFTIVILSLSVNLYAQEVSPFYDCGTQNGTLTQVKEAVKQKLKNAGFHVTGGYFVGGLKKWYVLTLSSKELQNVCLKVKDKGILASNLRVGFLINGGKVNITALNPKYLFLGYLRKDYDKYKNTLDRISSKFLQAVKSVTGKLTPFGGKVEASKLKEYHYMFGMPYFDDYIELNEFPSFEKAVETIKTNLKNKKSNTRLVYLQVYKNSKKAVFGVGLLDKEKGEAHFLPIIGEKHLAAMPYEIVVEGNKAYMLHGRFRFAMYWPSLSMSEFTKIMSTPGDVEDMLKSLTE